MKKIKVGDLVHFKNYDLSPKMNSLGIVLYVGKNDFYEVKWIDNLYKFPAEIVIHTKNDLVKI